MSIRPLTWSWEYWEFAKEGLAGWRLPGGLWGSEEGFGEIEWKEVNGVWKTKK